MPSSRRRCRQLIEELLRVAEVGGVEAFGEPAVGFGEKSAGVVGFALVQEETAQAQRRAQLPGFRALPPRNVDRLTERDLRIGLGRARAATLP
jgi:hypothetical protein